MKCKYYGKISYTIDDKHPDIKYVENWSENKVFTFEDVYHLNDDYTYEEVIDHIKHDLKLVAGGGYNVDHIHNVTFEIERI